MRLLIFLFALATLAYLVADRWTSAILFGLLTVAALIVDDVDRRRELDR